MKRNIEETGENVFTISSKMVSVDIDASKGSQEEGTYSANLPGVTGMHALLARLASEPVKSREPKIVALENRIEFEMVSLA